MKIGPVEGTPEEVNNYFKNNGLNPLDYFEKPEPQLKKIWLIIPSVIFVICFSALALLDDLSSKTNIFVFLFGLSSSVWVAVSVHIRFKSAWGAGAIIFIGILIMLVAMGVIQPEQIPEHYPSPN